jgi:hypothetical protein
MRRMMTGNRKDRQTKWRGNNVTLSIKGMTAHSADNDANAHEITTIMPV